MNPRESDAPLDGDLETEQENPAQSEPAKQDSASVEEVGEDAGPDEAVVALVESPEEAVKRLEGEVRGLQERHLRTAAEYDNFRKRTARERGELWTRAQAEVVTSILDALDDFGRVLDVNQSQAKVEDVIKGVELVQRKLVRELEGAGLERVGEMGEPFDPNHHEAIGSLPAESEDQDHTVGSVLQVGYKLGGLLLRPAKVQVLMWQGVEGSGV